MSYYASGDVLDTLKQIVNPYEKRGDVCYPSVALILEGVKNLQRNLNRLLALAGAPLLDVDGRPGPRTVQALNSGAVLLPATVTNCEQVIIGLDSLNSAVTQAVNIAGAPPVPDPKSSNPSMVVNGKVVHPSGQLFWWLAAAGVGAALWWKSKKRKRQPE